MGIMSFHGFKDPLGVFDPTIEDKLFHAGRWITLEGFPSQIVLFLCKEKVEVRSREDVSIHTTWNSFKSGWPSDSWGEARTPCPRCKEIVGTT